jgi:glucose-6-phosphate-specific signal transduction histidine kinase
MTEVIGAVIHVLGPSLVELIKRQFPDKVEQKWNQRVYDISGKVHDATKEGLDLDPHVLNEFLESAQLYDIQHHLHSFTEIMVHSRYREITQELHKLNEAKDAGDWNYLKRRSLKNAICRHGRITLNLGLVNSPHYVMHGHRLSYLT